MPSNPIHHDRRLTQDNFQRGLVDLGDPIRLARFREKCEHGQPITYGAIGGSITAGASAQPGKAYAPLLAEYLKAFTDVTFVNAGIGASNSLFGSFRVGKDLLSHQPDLITIEYAVNDANNPSIEPGYEALIHQCMSLPNAPLVILIFTMRRDGENTQNIHIPIGRHYGLPMLSYRDAVFPCVENGEWDWTDISPDEVHPNDDGHAMICEMLKLYLQSPVNQGHASEPIPALPAWLHPQAPRHVGRILDATALKCVSHTGWIQAPHRDGYTGWQSNQPGAELILQFTGNLAYFGYKKYAGDYGKVSAELDGKFIGEFDGFYEKPIIQQWAGGHTVIEPLSLNMQDGEHILQLKLLDTHHPDSHGHLFEMGYLLLS